MRSGRAKLAAVPDADAPLIIARDIYAAGREKREDRSHWAKVHIEADKRNLPRGWFRR